MALTYPLTSTLNEHSFKQEKSYFKLIAFWAGGFIVIFLGLFSLGSDAPVLISVVCILFGIGFLAAAFYLPYMNQRFTPEQITFKQDNQEVVFKMADGGAMQLPFSQIKEFVIDIEKRSPSAANSAGIHYLHHHINLKRHNEACWTITTTTDAVEANRVQKLLKGFTGQWNANDDQEINFNGSDKINLESDESHRIRWQEGRYELLIERDKIQYTEYKSAKVKAKVREFSLSTFRCVRYSYSGTIKNRNLKITIVFGDGPQESLNLFFRDLNPVECLQLERWLEQTIKKKLPS